MTGEQNLAKLLSSLSPELMHGEYVFHTFPDARYGDSPALEPFASVRESEGLTLIVPRGRADEHGLSYESVFRRITLGVHSSLDAVGLTAAFSSKLAEHGISANVIAGYYHDHIFVHRDHAEKAMAALRSF
ncbi:MAG: ACT domain-containing protein [Acidiferrobacterales bacterium]|nr:ACT domain-containing protein [Acidiferrobacterales bacterium]